MNGIHKDGIVTFTAAAAVVKGDILKFNAGKVTPCTTATDAAIGVALDGAAADGIVPVAICGAVTGTALVKAGGAIAQGAQIAADGTATADATDVIIGRALEAATASGDLIEVATQVAAVK